MASAGFFRAKYAPNPRRQSHGASSPYAQTPAATARSADTTEKLSRQTSGDIPFAVQKNAHGSKKTGSSFCGAENARFLFLRPRQALIQIGGKKARSPPPLIGIERDTGQLLFTAPTPDRSPPVPALSRSLHSPSRKERCARADTDGERLRARAAAGPRRGRARHRCRALRSHFGSARRNASSLRIQTYAARSDKYLALY